MGAIVAIDGPAGSGKSTLARRLALELGLPYVNTGQMYRALALRSARAGVDPGDVDGLAAIASGLRFDVDETLEPPSLRIDGEAPSPDLTSPEVESRVSRVSSHPEVRAILREAQRRLIEDGGVVEGRDIGSVVAPDAEVKLYLSADEDARVGRRSAERPERDVEDALVRRDTADAATNPFVPAHDAIEIDTTRMDADEVFVAALAVVRARLST
jgi:CMP/dCMP kinase